jgi:hypothetical protein
MSQQTTATEVKERPILFSGQMVRAILEGRKTQTRRVGKDQNHKPVAEDENGWYYQVPINHGSFIFNDRVHVPCPYGNPWAEPKERLWVRETWRPQHPYDLPGQEKPIYAADWTPEEFEQIYGKTWGWKPSIFMPRWASRITLEIVNVRVERLQEISEADAIAEGVYTNEQALQKLGLPADTKLQGTCVDKYRIVWESINGKKHPWASNPWVFVIEFKKIV